MNLRQKLKEYNNNLPQYEAKLSGALSKYKDLQNKGLEAYDSSLQAMKQIMLKNLCMPRAL